MDYCSSSGAVEHALHSNLVIFKSCCLVKYYTADFLYIPIWLYSNYMDGGSGLLDFIIFTFQSGYIQINNPTAA